MFLFKLSGPEACCAPGFARPCKGRALRGMRWDGMGWSCHSLPIHPRVSLFAKGWVCCNLSLYAEKSGLLEVRINVHWVFSARDQNADLSVLMFLMNLAPNGETHPLVTPLQVWPCHLTLCQRGPGALLPYYPATAPRKANIWALWTSLADGISWPTAETPVKALCNQPLPQG